MNQAHRKLCYVKKKKPYRTILQSDPISTGIRASILSKVQNLYDHIQQLHTRSSFLKTYVSTRSSVSASKTDSRTQRPFTPANNANMKRTSLSLTSRKYENPSKKQTFQLKMVHNGQILSNNQEQQWRLPTSQSNIRQMLKKRTKLLQQKDNDKIMKNPYYKIMRKRVKTSADETLSQETPQKEQNLCHQKQKMKTQCLNEVVEDDDNMLLKSNYSIKETSRKGISQGQGEICGIRQKSETKIYEQIKKYFEQKYGTYKSVNKK